MQIVTSYEGVMEVTCRREGSEQRWWGVNERLLQHTEKCHCWLVRRALGLHAGQTERFRPAGQARQAQAATRQRLQALATEGIHSATQLGLPAISL